MFTHIRTHTRNEHAGAVGSLLPAVSEQSDGHAAATGPLGTIWLPVTKALPTANGPSQLSGLSNRSIAG